MKKRFPAILLVCCVGVSLCACGSGSTQPAATQPAAQSQTNTGGSPSSQGGENTSPSSGASEAPEASIPADKIPGEAKKYGLTTWEFDENTGTLSIRGNGPMDDYIVLSDKGADLVTDAPWDAYRSSIIHINIEDGVTSIGNYAFARCAMRGFGLPQSVERIGKSAFSGCRDLQYPEMPGVMSIGDYAFSNCVSMTQIYFPDGLKAIGEYAFSLCMDLGGVNLPDSVTSLGAHAFDNCQRISTAILSNQLNSIETAAFFACVNLIEVEIPANVIVIEKDAFNNTSVRNIIYKGAQADWNMVGIAEGNKELLQAAVTCRGTEQPSSDVVLSGNCGKDGAPVAWTLDRSSGVLTISGTGAMADYVSYISTKDKEQGITKTLTPWHGYVNLIRTIMIEPGISEIGDNAFYYCTNLTKVVLPDGLCALGHDSFMDCRSLTNISLPKSVMAISQQVFTGCNSLTDVFYAGSQTDWENIYTSNPTGLDGIAIHYNSTN